MRKFSIYLPGIIGKLLLLQGKKTTTTILDVFVIKWLMIFKNYIMSSLNMSQVEGLVGQSRQQGP